MNLSNESKTLFIPLYGKALMSKNKIFLKDPKAEEIITKIKYDFKSLKQSKWLSMYMSLRASIIDELCNAYISTHTNSTIIHLGCGLDSRNLRVNQNYNKWYDIDFKEVIDIRKEFYKESSKYNMIGCSVLNYDWLNHITNNSNILIVAEGLTMYLKEVEIKDLLKHIEDKFNNVTIIFDAYTKKAIKASKIKNPINQMNAKVYYGINNPKEFLDLNKNLKYKETYLIKKNNNNLKGITKLIFNNLYCGKISQSYYKIYKFILKKEVQDKN